MEAQPYLLIILGMCAVSYLPRVVPALFISRIKFSPYFKRFLDLIPYTAFGGHRGDLRRRGLIDAVFSGDLIQRRRRGSGFSSAKELNFWIRRRMITRKVSARKR